MGKKGEVVWNCGKVIYEKKMEENGERSGRGRRERVKEYEATRKKRAKIACNS